MNQFEVEPWIDVHHVMYCIANQVMLEDIAGLDQIVCATTACVLLPHI